MANFIEITSKDNAVLKLVSSLQTSAKVRKETGLFVIEGLRICEDASENGVAFNKLIVTENALNKNKEAIKKLAEKCESCYIFTESLFKKISDTNTPQGILAVGVIPENNNKIDIKGRYIALENLQDPSNLGAVCRSAEALGLDGLIVSGGCDIYNPKALRAAMGSSLRMPVIIADNLVELIEKANGMGMQTLASTPRSTATDIRRISMDGGVICCVGNEGSGLTEEVISACKTAVVIPMTGRAESFNASAAAAILAWELKR